MKYIAQVLLLAETCKKNDRAFSYLHFFLYC